MTRDEFAKVVEVFKARREALGLPRREVARRAGLALTLVSRWESGGSVPGALHFIAWAEALGLFVDIVDGDGS